jgi:glycosyltransferase involved in cell wall biosynthesis
MECVAQNNGFICAINRNRDAYQVPRALYEHGLLSRFVTDYYAPDDPPRWLPGPLRRRHEAGLPHAATASAWGSFAVQAAGEIGRLPMPRIFAVTDRMLARTAGRIAARRKANLYCYSPYLPDDRDIQPGTKRVIFEYHPLPRLMWDVLAADYAIHPEVRWSFQRERGIASDHAQHDTWRRADAVVCASSITRASLVHAGCEPSRISVVPYGFAPPDQQHQDPVPTPGARREYLFVGQGVQRKGLHHLIKAWQALDLRDAHLTLVCYRIDPGIEQLIRSSSITLLGRQSATDLDALYKRADVFVMPSLIEGFGLVYLEALSRGCHVIGTSSLPDLALPAHAATVLSAGDIPALATALSTQHSSMLDRRAIRDAATRWTWADFRNAIGRHAAQLLDLSPAA